VFIQKIRMEETKIAKTIKNLTEDKVEFNY
jgi:hypothetical protein